MHIIHTLPVWGGVLLLVVKLVLLSNGGTGRKAPPAKRLPTIRREITVPDGTKTVMTVPATEPVSESIGRLYPNGLVPAYDAARITSHDGRNSSMSVPQQWFWVCAVGGVLFLGLLSFIGSRPEPSATTTQNYAAPPAVIRPYVPSLPQVRLKTGANVRSGPSRNAAVIRVGQKGEVFTKFGETNGWLQVGPAGTEVWIAQSVAEPAG